MLVCPACGRSNPEDARFCNSCGTALAADPAPGSEERKVVTVLFCDLVEFTARAERLDPEDIQAFLAPYHARLRAELERFGGTVEKFIGDAVMALFGAPVAHEDDPERAVRAALAIRDWVLEESDDLQVRIAVNTGSALVRLGARPLEGEGMATGDVVNTAARMQAAAPVNGILVGEQTLEATSSVIEYGPESRFTAKGKEEPVRVWEALQARSRYGVDLAERPKGPFVGRARELELLQTTLGRVIEERSPQLLTLVGVPGMGKSRLVFELFQAVDQNPERIVLWRQGRCPPYGDGVTFWALGEMVKAQAGMLESDPTMEVDRKLRRAVRSVVPDDVEARLIVDALRPLVGLGAGADLSSERLDQAFAAWRRFLESLAELRPLILVFEDLHWADPALLDFIDQLVDWATGVPLLVLATARPELLDGRPGWGGGKTNALTVSLAPLPEEATANLMSALLERSDIEPEARAALLARSGGNPLYAEQYSRILQEGGAPEDLPLSIQGIIAARLDALAAEEKGMLQSASVVGKVFWLGILEAVGSPPRWQAETLLHGLERKGFVRRARRSSVSGEAEYAFEHMLLQEVAYSQIPRAARSQKHRAAAEWIRSLGRMEDHAEMLAHHYGQALEYAPAGGTGDPELRAQVRRSMRIAGERAMSLGAEAAAVAFLDRALALCPDDAPERPGLLAAAGRARFFAEGTGPDLLEQAVELFESAGQLERAGEAAVELSRVHFWRGERDQAYASVARALRLTDGLPDSPAGARALVARSAYHMLASEYRAAIDLARRALPAVERLGMAPERARLLDVTGISRALEGDPGGLADLAQAIEAARDAGALLEYMVATNNLLNAQVFLGRMEEADAAMDSFRDLVTRFGTSTNRRWLEVGEAEVAYVRGRWDQAVAHLDRDLARSDQGFPFYLEPSARARRALVLQARGNPAAALAESERALELARSAKDAQLLVPALVTLARILAEQGRLGEVGALVTEIARMGRAGVHGVHQEAFGEGVVVLAWLARDLGRAEEVGALLAAAAQTPFIQAASEILSADPVVGADRLGRLRSLTAEAYARLRAGRALIESGRPAEGSEQLRKAMEFYRSVGAVTYVDEAAALLERAATPAG